VKALSLWQPWATLIALGHKRFETRHWPTSYRGPLAIHAAKRRMTDEEHSYLLDLIYWEEIALPDPDEFPLGVIVATATLVGVHHIGVSVSPDDQTELELEVGNWEAGRFAWELAGVRPLAQPIPARGAQGLWEWTPPADLEALYAPQVAS
jgi:hypothetical protein